MHLLPDIRVGNMVLFYCKERGINMSDLKKALTSLLKVKSIVTIILTVVFAYLSIVGIIDGQQFLTVFSMVMAFYFGTQHEKKTKEAEATETTEGSEA